MGPSRWVSEDLVGLEELWGRRGRPHARHKAVLRCIR